MNLSNDTIRKIVGAVKLGRKLGIDGLIFDQNGIRGYNDDDAILIFALGDLGFEFDELGLARVPALDSKLRMLDFDSVTAEVTTRPNSEVIKSIIFRSNRVDFEFRCALAKTINDFPSKKMNTAPIFSFEVNKEDVDFMSQGASSNKAKNVTVQSKGRAVVFRFSDDTGDITNYKLETPITFHTDDETMSFTANVRKLIGILKDAVQDEKITVNILKRNVIHIQIDGLDVMVMPEV